MFYRDNTTFGLSIEIANLSNLSGWPSQTKTFHLSCLTALSLSKKLLYLESKILKLHFQNQSNLWVGQNIMAIHQLLRTILKAFCQSPLNSKCDILPILANRCQKEQTWFKAVCRLQLFLHEILKSIYVPWFAFRMYCRFGVVLSPISMAKTNPSQAFFYATIVSCKLGLKTKSRPFFYKKRFTPGFTYLILSNPYPLQK